jgi:hypothetical protein
VQLLLENIVKTEQEDSTEVAQILRAEDEALVNEPQKKLCPHFKKLRQAYYKEKYQSTKK